MAQYKVPDADELFQCPYNDTHMVRAKKLPYHLRKCRKNHVGVELVVCPFNARHEVHRLELAYHKTTCPDKAIVEQDINYEGGRTSDTSRRVKLCDWQPPPTDEDWNKDIPAGPIMKIDPQETRGGRTEIEAIRKLTDEQKERLQKTAEENQERLRLGLPPLEPTEKLHLLASNRLRLPTKQPKALQATMESRREKKKKATKPSVFEYSVSLAGVGRGRGVLQMFNEPDHKVGLNSRGSAAKSSQSHPSSSLESKDSTDVMSDSVAGGPPNFDFSIQEDSASVSGFTTCSSATSVQDLEERLAAIMPSDFSVRRLRNDFAVPKPLLVSAGVGRGQGRKNKQTTNNTPGKQKAGIPRPTL